MFSRMFCRKRFEINYSGKYVYSEKKLYDLFKTKFFNEHMDYIYIAHQCHEILSNGRTKSLWIKLFITTGIFPPWWLGQTSKPFKIFSDTRSYHMQSCFDHSMFWSILEDTVLSWSFFRNKTATYARTQNTLSFLPGKRIDAIDQVMQSSVYIILIYQK